MVNIPFSDVFGRIWGYRLELVREHQNGDTLPNLGKMFSFKSLKKATKNFRNRLREDGYRSCYKGTLENGTLVEVQVSRKSHSDFFSVMRIMSRISHRNVDELIGYCAEANHWIIVCKFMGDYDLNHLLFNKEGECSKLSWPMRASICLGVAQGIEYLHQGISPRVVHRDIKPSNVVVDDNFNPKITNFDIATQISNDSSDLTELAGTFGYIDPEYMRTGRLTEKADVYSFGVLLLEVITGRKNMQFPLDDGDTRLIDWVWNLRESGRIREIVDPTLSEFPQDEVVRFFSVALHCVQLSSNLRPSMFEVLHMLTGAIDFNNRTLTNPRHSIWDERNSLAESISDELNSPTYTDSICVQLGSPIDSNFDELNTPADGQRENEVLCAQNEMDMPDALTVTAENANPVGTCSNNDVLVTTDWEIFELGDGSLAQPSVLSSTKITQDWERFD